MTLYAESSAVLRWLFSEPESAEIADVFDAFAAAVARWGILDLSREVTDRAEDRFPIEPVRTLEAIHLASALNLRQAITGLRVLSTDERVRGNALRLGFEVVPG